MMRSNIGNVGQAAQEAVASNTFSAAGSESVSPALPSGSTGKPIYFEISGTVAGYAVLNIGTTAQLVVTNNPAAGPTRKAIPSTAFKGPVNSVPVTLTAAAAGTLTAVVGFA